MTRTSLCLDYPQLRNTRGKLRPKQDGQIAARPKRLTYRRAFRRYSLIDSSTKRRDALKKTRKYSWSPNWTNLMNRARRRSSMEARALCDREPVPTSVRMVWHLKRSQAFPKCGRCLTRLPESFRIDPNRGLRSAISTRSPDLTLRLFGSPKTPRKDF